MADEIVTVERCRHCGCEWVCPDCGGVAGAQPPAETPIETCACGTVWPANRLPAPAFPAHCPACRPDEWAGAMPFLGERIKPIRRALARTLTDAEIDAAEALANGAKPFDPAASWAFYQRARTDVPALARTARAERRRAEEAERERDRAHEEIDEHASAIERADEMLATVAKLERERDAAKATIAKARALWCAEPSRILGAVLTMLGHEEAHARTESAMMADVAHLVRRLRDERDAAKAIADAWAEWHAATKTLRGAQLIDDVRDRDVAAVDAARAKLAALGVTL